jgi:hypothetical protein
LSRIIELRAILSNPKECVNDTFGYSSPGSGKEIKMALEDVDGLKLLILISQFRYNEKRWIRIGVGLGHRGEA